MSGVCYDAVVVGGGPAGAGVAAWLAREGWHVALLDRSRFPRDKACGEFLTPDACRLLGELDAWNAVESAGARPVLATVLVSPQGASMRHAPEEGGPAGYAIRRTALDAVLLEQARASGVEVYEGFTVRSLLRNAQGQVTGVAGREAGGAPGELRGRLVVGADGTHSLVARQLGSVRPLARLQRIAVVTHWRNVPGDGDTIEMRSHNRIVCGLGFPGGQEEALCANLTLVAPTEMAPRIAGRAGDFVEETLETHFPDLAARFAGAERESMVRTIGCFGHVCRPPIAEGALLVGDAATFIDPFTGEGVYFALRGAQLAAEVATEALRAGDTSRRRLSAYGRARQELAQRYLLCDVVQSVVRAPHLFDRFVRRLDRYPGLAERLMRILGDVRPPTDALHPLFLWRLLAPKI
jgi:geranylgeranyl reductase family protein